MAQLSFLKTGGNTETSVLGMGAEAKHKDASRWSFLLKGGFARGSVSGQENLRNLLASARAGLALRERTDLFVEAAYAEDSYAGIDSRLGAELGLSHQIKWNEPHHLSLDAGLGLVREIRLPGRLRNDFVSARSGFHYKYRISKTADFQNQANITANLTEGRDWRLSNVTSLTAALNAHFSMKLSHSLIHLNTPPLAKKKTDTTIAAGIVARF